MKLAWRFAEKGYHSCVMTTFGIDFSAFENIALPRLRSVGCNNTIVLADAGMLAYSLDHAAKLPAHAGTRYTVTGSRTTGVFHPKIWLQVGRADARLLVGSANLTAPGMAGNHEVVGEIRATADQPGQMALVSAAWRYVREFLDTDRPGLAGQIALINRLSPWLRDTVPAKGVVTLPGEEAAAFMHSRGASTIATQFVNAVKRDGAVRRLIVISPYWDEDLTALRTLQRATDAAQVSVLVGGSCPSFPSHALNPTDGIDLFRLDRNAHRFVHAKVIIAQTRDADHVLYGSANCTGAGLGTGRRSAMRNDEACLYRQMRRDAAIRELRLSASLSKDQRLAEDRRPGWHATPPLPLNAALSRSPGTFSLTDGNLRWRPSEAFVNADATVELLDKDRAPIVVTLLEVSAHLEGERRFSLVGPADAAAFAKASIGGTASALAVICRPDVLHAEMREPRTGRLKAALDSLARVPALGSWILQFIDLIETAETAQPIPPISAGRKSERRRRKAGPMDPAGGDRSSYETFIQGRRVRARGTTEADIALPESDLQLVRSYLNRLIGLGMAQGRFDVGEDEADVARALAMGDPDVDTEGEEGGSCAEDEALVADPPAGPTLSAAEQRNHTLQDQRNALAERVGARYDIAGFARSFSEQMHTRSGGVLALSDMLRLRAVLLMLVGASCPVGATLFDSRRTSTHVLAATGQDSWVRLLGIVLHPFFSSPEPLIAHYAPAQPSVELIECFATCFWAIQACQAGFEASGDRSTLGEKLRRMASDVYRWSPLRDGEREHPVVIAVLEKMTATFDLGVPEGEILALHRRTFDAVLAVPLVASPV